MNKIKSRLKIEGMNKMLPFYHEMNKLARKPMIARNFTDKRLTSLLNVSRPFYAKFIDGKLKYTKIFEKNSNPSKSTKNELRAQLHSFLSAMNIINNNNDYFSLFKIKKYKNSLSLSFGDEGARPKLVFIRENSNFDVFLISDSGLETLKEWAGDEQYILELVSKFVHARPYAILSNGKNYAEKSSRGKEVAYFWSKIPKKRIEQFENFYAGDLSRTVKKEAFWSTLLQNPVFSRIKLAHMTLTSTSVSFKP